MQDILNNIVKINYNKKINQEDSYNIFSVLGIEAKEVYICKMIADLLNPRGRHKNKSAYLELFIKNVLNIEISDQKVLDNAVVSTEYMITKNRRIDIAIEIGNMFIPIEVKVYASDQKSQCYDCLAFSKIKDENSKIVYLTRFGDIPSDYSIKSNGDFIDCDDIICISFEKDIVNWCKECILTSNDEMKSIIAQFTDILIELTNHKDKDVVDMISDELVKSPDLLRAGIQISNSINAAKAKVLYSVMGELATQMNELEEKLGLQRETEIKWYEYTDCADEDFYKEYSTYPGINYIIKNTSSYKDYQLWFRVEVQHRLLAGFCVFDIKNCEEVTEFDEETISWIKENLKFSPFEQDSWWAIWRYLPTGNKKYTADVPNFKDMNEVAIKLAEPEFRKAFVAEAIEKIQYSILSILK